MIGVRWMDVVLLAALCAYLGAAIDQSYGLNAGFAAFFIACQSIALARHPHPAKNTP